MNQVESNNLQEVIKLNSRYIIGIDLGTTNCSVSYIDTFIDEYTSKSLLITQPLNFSQNSKEELLPSLIYIPTSSEASSIPISLKTEQFLVGRICADIDSDRVISSAKSWLCYRAISKNDKFLPFNSESVIEEQKVSAVYASSILLKHIKNSWDNEFAGDTKEYSFESQQIIVTVPASFDEVALRLTSEACEQANYPKNTSFVEEPKSAFYYILESNHHLFDLIPKNKKGTLNILVVDVGGGTTDLSLFEYTNKKEIIRTKVGSHILLGGDNMDLTLQRYIESRISEPLSKKQRKSILFQCKKLKEKIFNLSDGLYSESSDSDMLNSTRSNPDKLPNEYTFSIISDSSSLFAKSINITFNIEEIKSILLDGFFGISGQNDIPKNKTSGLREIGLPYSNDINIIKHIAYFIQGHSIDAIMFNGGALKPILFRDRIKKCISEWQKIDSSNDYKENSIIEIKNPSMDLSVSFGATYYGLSQRNLTTKIGGGYQYSVYLELPDGKNRASNALCILPKGADNKVYSIKEKIFEALIGIPVQFNLYYSNSREDNPGDIIQLDNYSEFEDLELNQLKKLTPVYTVIGIFKKEKKTKKVNVYININITETGILKLSLVNTENNTETWDLDFNIRDNKLNQDNDDSKDSFKDSNIDLEKIDLSKKYIQEIFGKPITNSSISNPKELIRKIEKILHKEKKDWDIFTLRSFWSSLYEGITKRNRSKQHESVWLSLAGYILRPGFGTELDHLRIHELWRLNDLGLAFPKETESNLQLIIMWRRVCGGLNKERQEILYSKYINKLNENNEIIKLLSSLERIDNKNKLELSSKILKLIPKTQNPSPLIWSLSKIGSRTLVHGGIQNILSPSIVFTWFKELINLNQTILKSPTFINFCSQVFRKTGNNDIDLSVEERNYIIDSLESKIGWFEALEGIREVREIGDEEMRVIMGEELPYGINIISDDGGNVHHH